MLKLSRNNFVSYSKVDNRLEIRSRIVGSILNKQFIKYLLKHVVIIIYEGPNIIWSKGKGPSYLRKEIKQA